MKRCVVRSHNRAIVANKFFASLRIVAKWLIVQETYSASFVAGRSHPHEAVAAEMGHAVMSWRWRGSWCRLSSYFRFSLFSSAGGGDVGSFFEELFFGVLFPDDLPEDFPDADFLSTALFFSWNKQFKLTGWGFFA